MWYLVWESTMPEGTIGSDDVLLDFLAEFLDGNIGAVLRGE